MRAELLARKAFTNGPLLFDRIFRNKYHGFRRRWKHAWEKKGGWNTDQAYSDALEVRPWELSLASKKSFHQQSSSVWKNFQKQIPDMVAQMMGMNPEHRSVLDSGRPRTLTCLWSRPVLALTAFRIGLASLLKCLWSRLVLTLTAFRVGPAALFHDCSAAPNPKVSAAQAHLMFVFRDGATIGAHAPTHPQNFKNKNFFWYRNFRKFKN